MSVFVKIMYWYDRWEVWTIFFFLCQGTGLAVFLGEMAEVRGQAGCGGVALTAEEHNGIQ